MKHLTNQSHFIETDPSLVRAELERLLSDRRFSGARQMSAFLRYIVNETLDGNAKRIKAYTVGVDALGKADDFDAQADPSVRVLALRLRKSLEAAYTEDTDCHARIVMSVGTYVPEFYKPHAFAQDNDAEVSPQKADAELSSDASGSAPLKDDISGKSTLVSRQVSDTRRIAHRLYSTHCSQRSDNGYDSSAKRVAGQAIASERASEAVHEKWVWTVLAVVLLASAWKASTNLHTGASSLSNVHNTASTDALRIMPVLRLQPSSVKNSD